MKEYTKHKQPNRKVKPEAVRNRFVEGDAWNKEQNNPNTSLLSQNRLLKKWGISIDDANRFGKASKKIYGETRKLILDKEVPWGCIESLYSPMTTDEQVKQFAQKISFQPDSGECAAILYQVKKDFPAKETQLKIIKPTQDSLDNVIQEKESLARKEQLLRDAVHLESCFEEYESTINDFMDEMREKIKNMQEALKQEYNEILRNNPSLFNDQIS